MADKEAQVDWDDNGFLDIDEYYERELRLRRLEVAIERLQRNLHDEQVRREEWEKMYNQAITGTEVERLQAELAQVSMVLTDANELHAEVRAELAQVCAELNRVRQDAQDQNDEVQELWLNPCEAEGLKRQLAGAGLRVRQAGRRTENLQQEKVGIHKVLDECQIPRNYDDGKLASAQTRIVWLNRRAEHTETLAALVTPELALLLKRLAICTAAHADSFASPHSSWVLRRRVEVKDARELAAHIRQVLETNSGD